MADSNALVTVFTGYEVNIQHLQNIFTEEGIDFIIKNDSDSALRAGFGSALPGQARILVPQSQKIKAERLVKETFPNYKEEE